MKWVQNDAGGAKYLTLHRNLAMNGALRPASARHKYPTELPYDYSSPAVDNDTIKKRTCTHCKMYFGAINARDNHQKTCASRNPNRRRPRETSNVPRNASIQHDIASNNDNEEVAVHATPDPETTEEENVRPM